MKKCLLMFVFIMVIASLFSYSLGTYNKTFIDPARNNRQIPTTIFYPIDSANPFASYPYIVYGHGWNGSCDSYGTLTNGVVNLGWIIAYPRTEESWYSYNPPNLALDMVFLKAAVLSEAQNLTSPLYGKIDDLAIIGGYSMGGACAVAAASMAPGYVSLITLAAAPITALNLYPSAINLATQVMMPSVTFSGTADNTAPPAQNQVPIYNNLASTYKSFISFTGQGHINFYNNSLIYDILDPWLEFIKTGSVYYTDQFESLLAGYSASTLTYQLVNNLVIDLNPPANVRIEGRENTVTLSWDNQLEAHGYKVFAADNRLNTYSDVTTEGNFTVGERVNWITQAPSIGHRVFYIKSWR